MRNISLHKFYFKCGRLHTEKLWSLPFSLYIYKIGQHISYIFHFDFDYYSSMKLIEIVYFNICIIIFWGKDE